jgi:hypothetical protein
VTRRGRIKGSVDERQDSRGADPVRLGGRSGENTVRSAYALDGFAYLTDVLAELAARLPYSRIGELLPGNSRPAQAETVATHEAELAPAPQPSRRTIDPEDCMNGWGCPEGYG